MEASTVIFPVLLCMHAHVCALTTCDDYIHVAMILKRQPNEEMVYLRSFYQPFE